MAEDETVGLEDELLVLVVLDRGSEDTDVGTAPPVVLEKAVIGVVGSVLGAGDGVKESPLWCKVDDIALLTEVEEANGASDGLGVSVAGVRDGVMD